VAIVTERPKRPRLVESPSNALLKQPATGAWPSPLLTLFKERLQAGPTSADDQGMSKPPLALLVMRIVKDLKLSQI